MNHAMVNYFSEYLNLSSKVVTACIQVKEVSDTVGTCNLIRRYEVLSEVKHLSNFNIVN